MWPFRRNDANAIRSSQPYWLMRNGIGDAGAPLVRDLECDIAIIGAGITGALVADALLGTGARIALFDARDAGTGSTAASTALLQYEIDTDLVDLARRLGAERALRAYGACLASFATLETRYADLLAAADYERRDSLYLASDEAAVGPLRAEFDARRAAGVRCEWLAGDELPRRFGCVRPAAILSGPAAQIDPLRFTRALLAGVLRHGAALHARTRIATIREAGERFELSTEAGHTVRARHVLVCSGYESTPFLPYAVADVHNTFALVTEPLAGRRRAQDLPLIWESSRPYLYVRGTRDGRLVVGGEDVPFRNALARDALLPRQVRRLGERYADLMGEALPPVSHAWAGSFAETADGLPFIGAIPGRNPRLHYALCYGGNGITFALCAGEILRAHVEGSAHALDDTFGFGRPGASPGQTQDPAPGPPLAAVTTPARRR